MKLRELADLILDKIGSGDLDPDAVVVRPLCACDEDVGYVEAQFVDQVSREIHAAPNVDPHGLIYRHSSNERATSSATTVKLG
jgi:hypothetical protein